MTPMENRVYDIFCEIMKGPLSEFVSPILQQAIGQNCDKNTCESTAYFALEMARTYKEVGEKLMEASKL